MSVIVDLGFKYYKTVTYPDGHIEHWYIIPGVVYGPYNLIRQFLK